MTSIFKFALLLVQLTFYSGVARVKSEIPSYFEIGGGFPEILGFKFRDLKILGPKIQFWGHFTGSRGEGGCDLETLPPWLHH